MNQQFKLPDLGPVPLDKPFSDATPMPVESQPLPDNAPEDIQPYTPTEEDIQKLKAAGKLAASYSLEDAAKEDQGIQPYTPTPDDLKKLVRAGRMTQEEADKIATETPSEGGYFGETGKGIIAGALEGVGQMLHVAPPKEMTGRMDANQKKWSELKTALPSVASMDDAQYSKFVKDAQDIYTFASKDEIKKLLDTASAIRAGTADKSAAAFPSYLDAPYDFTQSDVFKAGDSINKVSQDNFAAAPGWEDSWTRSISSGVGSTLPFMAAGLAGGPLGISAGTAAGMMASSGQAVDTALGKHASKEDALLAGQIATSIGATEMLPIEIVLSRVPPQVKNAVAKAIIKIGESMAGEGIQEGVSQLLQNLTANYVYDPNLSPMDGVLQNAGMGAIVGGIFGGAHAAGAHIVHKGAAVDREAPPSDDPATQGADGAGNSPSPASSVTPEHIAALLHSGEAARDIIGMSPEEILDRAQAIIDSGESFDQQTLIRAQRLIQSRMPQYIPVDSATGEQVPQTINDPNDEAIPRIGGVGNRLPGPPPVAQNPFTEVVPGVPINDIVAMKKAAGQDIASGVLNKEPEKSKPNPDIIPIRIEHDLRKGTQQVLNEDLLGHERKPLADPLPGRKPSILPRPDPFVPDSSVKGLTPQDLVDFKRAGEADAMIATKPEPVEPLKPAPEPDNGNLSARTLIDLQKATDSELQSDTPIPMPPPEPQPLLGYDNPKGHRSNPIDLSAGEDITDGRPLAAEPSDKQKAAGNYQKVHASIHGVDVAIETPKGGTRSGVDPDGKSWSVEMPGDYGYAKRSNGADGDNVDVIIGDNHQSDRIFVIDQMDPATGKFDEHKVVMGTSTKAEAADLYRKGFTDGGKRNRISDITTMTPDQFKEWLKNGDTKAPVGQKQSKPIVGSDPKDTTPAAPVSKNKIKSYKKGTHKNAHDGSYHIVTMEDGRKIGVWRNQGSGGLSLYGEMNMVPLDANDKEMSITEDAYTNAGSTSTYSIKEFTEKLNKGELDKKMAGLHDNADQYRKDKAERVRKQKLADKEAAKKKADETKAAATAEKNEKKRITNLRATAMMTDDLSTFMSTVKELMNALMKSAGNISAAEVAAVNKIIDTEIRVAKGGTTTAREFLESVVEEMDTELGMGNPNIKASTQDIYVDMAGKLFSAKLMKVVKPTTPGPLVGKVDYQHDIHKKSKRPDDMNDHHKAGSNFIHAYPPAPSKGETVSGNVIKWLRGLNKSKKVEYIVGIDDDGTMLGGGTENRAGAVSFNDALSSGMNNPDRKIAVYHNHPETKGLIDGGTLSDADIYVLGNLGLHSVWAISDNYESRAQLTERARLAKQFTNSTRDAFTARWETVTSLEQAYKRAASKIGNYIVSMPSTLSHDVETDMYHHAIVLIMDRAHIINYTTTRPYDLSIIPGLDAEISIIAKEIENDFYAGKTPSSNAGRSTTPFKHIGEVGSTLVRNAGSAQVRDEQGSLHRDSSAEYQNEEGVRSAGPPERGQQELNRPAPRKERDLSVIDILYGDFKPIKRNSRTITQVAAELMERSQKALKALGVESGKLPWQEITPAHKKMLSRVIALEVKSAMDNNPAHAGSWYTKKVEETIDTYAIMHPEVATDPKMRTAFTAALAVTSQGEVVPSNVRLADQVYNHFKRTGRFPTDINAKQKAAMNDNFKKLNKLIESNSVGLDGLTEFLSRELTAKELKDLGYNISANNDDIVRGSLILGPKIGGGFYQNLNGNYTPVTFDLWFMRAWGRLTGTLTGQLDEAAYEKTKGTYTDALESEGLDVPSTEEGLVELAQEQVGQHERNFVKYRDEFDAGIRSKSKSTNAAIAYMKAVEGINQQPKSSGNRNVMTEVVNMAREELEKQGITLTNADLQAVWWYPEKTLYEKLGGKGRKSEDINVDYASSIRELLTEKKGYTDDEVQHHLNNNAGKRGLQSLEPGGRGPQNDRRGSYLSSPEGRGIPEGQSEAEGRRRQRPTALPGAPRLDGQPGLIEAIAGIAEEYARQEGIDFKRQGEYVEVDEARAKRIAQAYEDMKHEPQDPKVKEAYADLIKQTTAQYKALIKGGYEFYFFDPNGTDPYADMDGGFGNPRNAIRDLRDNKRMAVFPTYEGYGSGSILDIGLADPKGGPDIKPEVVLKAVRDAGGVIEEHKIHPSDSEPTLVIRLKKPIDKKTGDALSETLGQEAIVQRTDDEKGEMFGPMAEEWGPYNPEYFVVMDGRRASEIANPMLADTEFEWPVGSIDSKKTAKVTANDLFRAVHDAFGHGLEGATFRARGEENAWQAHVRLFTGPAVGAITTETRGQNSWLNFGPHGKTNRTAKIEDTIFAEQKVGLMPSWTWERGRVESAKDPNGFTYLVHGGSDFNNIDLSKSGTGEPGNIRPLGDGLYTYVLDPDNPSQMKKLINGAKRYSEKYGGNSKKLHLFKVPNTATAVFNGAQRAGWNNGFNDKEKAYSEALGEAEKLPVGPERSAAYDKARSLRPSKEERSKPQLRGERLPSGSNHDIEMAIHDPSVAERVGKFNLDADAQDIIDAINSDMAANQPLRETSTTDAPQSDQREDVVWSNRRIKQELDTYGYAYDDRSKGYVAWVSPQDFLDATVGSKETSDIIERDSVYYDDLDKVSNNSQTPFLTIEDGAVVGHEGRHRMAALARAGIKSVPIVVHNRGGGKSLTKKSSMKLKWQFRPDSGSVTVTNAIPLNMEFKDDIKAGMVVPRETVTLNAPTAPINNPNVTTANAPAVTAGTRLTAMVSNHKTTSKKVTSKIKQAVGNKRDRFLDAEDESFGEYINRKMGDYLSPLKLMIEKAEKSGIKVAEYADAYLQARLSEGVLRDQLMRVNNSFVVPMTKAIAEAGSNLSEAHQYFYALHAEERNKVIGQRHPVDSDMYKAGTAAGEDLVGGSGMSTAKAKKIIADIKADPAKAAKLDEAHKFLRDMLDAALMRQLKAGLITRDQYNDMKAKWKNYVPLRAEHDMDIGGLIDSHRGRGFDIRGDEVKAAVGRYTEADNVLVYAVTKAENAILRAEKNKVGNAALRFMNIYDPKGENGYGEVYSKELPKDGPMDQDTYETVGDLEGADTVYKRVLKKDGKVGWEKVNKFALDEDVVSTKVGGRQYFIRFSDPKIGLAMKKLTFAELGMLGKMAGTLTRWQTFMNTRGNPAFIMTNLFRDVIGAPFILLRDDVSVKDGLKLMARVPTLWAALYRHSKGIKGTTANDLLVQDFMEAGGRISFDQFNTVEQNMKRMQKDIANSANVHPFKAALKELRNIIGVANDIVENGTRLSAFKTLRDQGQSKQKAALGARDLIDFQRKGELSPQFNAVFAFFNSSVQGGIVFKQAFKHKKFKAALATLILGGALQTILGHMFAGDDDEGRNRYDVMMELEPWKFERQMVFFYGEDKYFTVPLPYIFNAFWHLGATGMAAGMGKIPPQAMALDSLRVFFDSANPLGSGDFMSMITPTALDPALDLYRNKDWLGRPIHTPDNPYSKNEDPAYLDPRGYVNPAFTKFSEMLNSATGGDSVVPGSVNVSPNDMEYLFGWFFGGLGRFGSQSFETGVRASEGEFVPEKTPFARTFLGQQSEFSNVKQYYDIKERVDQATYYAKKYVAQKDTEGLAALKKERPLDLKMSPIFSGVNKAIRRINKALNAAEATGDTAKVEKLTKVKNDMMDKARRAYLNAEGSQ